jgi:multisubunit Na+/H+ antiporter MnhB subunit
MDVSKLPRLSKTQNADSTPTVGANEVSPAPSEQRIQSGRGPEAWISIGVGLIFLFAFPHFTQWLVHTVFHTKTVPSFLPITDENNVEIPYQKSIFFMSDLCVAIFTYALIVEGITLLLAKRPIVVAFALLVTAAAVLLNLYYLIQSFGDGFPMVSAIAVVFGGYMLWYQWRLLQMMRGRFH